MAEMSGAAGTDTFWVVLRGGKEFLTNGLAGTGVSLWDPRFLAADRFSNVTAAVMASLRYGGVATEVTLSWQVTNEARVITVKGA